MMRRLKRINLEEWEGCIIYDEEVLLILAAVLVKESWH